MYNTGNKTGLKMEFKRGLKENKIEWNDTKSTMTKNSLASSNFQKESWS